MTKTILAYLVLLLLSSSVYADCTYDGSIYPTGTIFGPLVCSGDGSWVGK